MFVLFLIICVYGGLISADNKMKYEVSVKFYYFKWLDSKLSSKGCKFNSKSTNKCKWNFEVTINKNIDCKDERSCGDSGCLLKKEYEFPFEKSFNFYGIYAPNFKPALMVFQVDKLEVRLKVNMWINTGSRRYLLENDLCYIIQPTDGKWEVKDIPSGSDGPKLSFEMKAKCSQGFYGDNCDVYCVLFRNYFNCNLTTGKKICLKNLKERYCNEYLSKNKTFFNVSCDCASIEKDGCYKCKLNITTNQYDGTKDKIFVFRTTINIPIVYVYYAAGAFLGILIAFIITVAIIYNKRRPRNRDHNRPLPTPPEQTDGYIKPMNSFDNDEQQYDTIPKYNPNIENPVYDSECYIPLKSPLPQRK